MSGDGVRRIPNTRDEQWTTAQEIADELGVHVDTVYRISPSDLPYTRVGRLRRYRREDYRRWLESQKVESWEAA